MTNFDLKFSTLKAYGPESDIDVLCIGPYIATLQVSVNFVFCLCWQILKFTQNVFMCWLQHHFFVVLRQMLEGRPEVSELQSIEGAKVPLMRFKFNGILVDFPYVQLPFINAAEVSIWSFTTLYVKCVIFVDST